MSTSNVELEVKFRCKDLNELRKKLLDMGAKPIDSVEMVDVYLQHPCWNFAERDEALRVRLIRSSQSRSESVEITYKGPRSQGWAKARVELVVKADDFQRTLQVFDSLGFREVARLAKRREFFEIDNVEVSLDMVEGLGEFVELEDRGAGGEGLRRVAERLGLRDLVRETYLELYLKKMGVRAPT